MTKNILLEKLQNSISAGEYTALAENTIPHISEHNRTTLLEMMTSTSSDKTDVSVSKVESLKTTLENYLGIYLPEDKTCWKWIILSCIYLCFICNRPLHSRDSVHYTETHSNGEQIYYCPYKPKKEGTACSFCVCKSMI